MWTRILSAAVAVSSLTLAGCDIFDDDDDDNPLVTPASLRVLHASPDAPAVNVLVDGAVTIAGADYKAGTAFSNLTPGSYSVQVDGIVPGGTTPVIGPVDLDLESGIRYTVIATGEVANIAPQIIAAPFESVPAGSVRATVVHAAPNAPEVTVFVTAPGTDLSGEAPLGTFSFGGTLGPAEIPNGDYQIRVTLNDDVIYDSGTVTLADGAELVIAAVETATPTEAAESPISLIVLDGNGAAEIADIDTPTGFRVIHNSPDAPAVDVVVNDDFDNPILEDVPYTAFSDFINVPAATYNVKVTAANAPGTIVIDADVPLDAGQEYSVYAIDELASIRPQVLEDDRRSVATEAKVRIVHGSPSAGPVDIVITAADGSTQEFQGVEFEAETGYLALAAGSYDVAVSVAGTTTVAIAAPITVEAGGVYTAVARDPEPGQTDFGLILLDDFND
ncbi:MAG: DUF4397 domain-containing protein [Pseudomonadota bacterium]